VVTPPVSGETSGDGERITPSFRSKFRNALSIIETDLIKEADSASRKEDKDRQVFFMIESTIAAAVTVLLKHCKIRYCFLFSGVIIF
jgi:hypothetical protein